MAAAAFPLSPTPVPTTTLGAAFSSTEIILKQLQQAIQEASTYAPAKVAALKTARDQAVQHQKQIQKNAPHFQTLTDTLSEAGDVLRPADLITQIERATIANPPVCKSTLDALYVDAGCYLRRLHDVHPLYDSLTTALCKVHALLYPQDGTVSEVAQKALAASPSVTKRKKQDRQEPVSDANNKDQKTDVKKVEKEPVDPVAGATAALAKMHLNDLPPQKADDLIDAHGRLHMQRMHALGDQVSSLREQNNFSEIGNIEILLSTILKPPYRLSENEKTIVEQLLKVIKAERPDKAVASLSRQLKSSEYCVTGATQATVEAYLKKNGHVDNNGPSWILWPKSTPRDNANSLLHVLMLSYVREEGVEHFTMDNTQADQHFNSTLDGFLKICTPANCLSAAFCDTLSPANLVTAAIEKAFGHHESFRYDETAARNCLQKSPRALLVRCNSEKSDSVILSFVKKGEAQHIVISVVFNDGVYEVMFPTQKGSPAAVDFILLDDPHFAARAMAILEVDAPAFADAYSIALTNLLAAYRNDDDISSFCKEIKSLIDNTAVLSDSDLQKAGAIIDEVFAGIDVSVAQVLLMHPYMQTSYEKEVHLERAAGTWALVYDSSTQSPRLYMKTDDSIKEHPLPKSIDHFHRAYPLSHCLGRALEYAPD